MKAEQDSPRVTFPPPFIFLGILAAGVGLEFALGGPWLGIPALIRFASGGAMFAGGIAIIVGAADLFRKAGTNIEPWRESTAIVSTGLYRWSRNPIYLGMAVAYVGLAVAFDSLIASALVPVVILVVQTQVIAREERYLEAKFGDTYRSYKARVRRWL